MLGLGGRAAPALQSSGALPGALGVVGPPLSLDVLPPRLRGHDQWFLQPSSSLLTKGPTPALPGVCPGG